MSRMNSIRLSFFAFLLGPLAAGAWAQSVSIDLTPTIGDIGNPADSNGYGSVSYTYAMARTEVTNAQYVAFLNATAAADPYGLFDTFMTLDPNGGIVRSGASGSFNYTLKSADWGNRPVNYVSIWDGARFVNWLENGQGNGSTETGVYALNGVVTPNVSAIARASGASWVLPTVNEWYKAAYYDPTLGASGGYWLHAVRSNTLGNNTDFSAANGANYYDGDGVVNRPGGEGPGMIAVGSYANASSYYGTFDQAGNVWESVIAPGGVQIWGGSAQDPVFYQSSGGLSPWGASFADDDVGFRVARLVVIPEPATSTALCGVLGLGLALWRRRRM